MLTVLALGIETWQTHLVIELSNYDGYFAPIRCSLCIQQEKLIDRTVHDCYSLQSCMVGFRTVSTFFIAFFSDFGRNGFVEN